MSIISFAQRTRGPPKNATASVRWHEALQLFVEVEDDDDLIRLRFTLYGACVDKHQEASAIGGDVVVPSFPSEELLP